MRGALRRGQCASGGKPARRSCGRHTIPAGRGAGREPARALVGGPGARQRGEEPREAAGADPVGRGLARLVGPRRRRGAAPRAGPHRPCRRLAIVTGARCDPLHRSVSHHVGSDTAPPRAVPAGSDLLLLERELRAEEQDLLVVAVPGARDAAPAAVPEEGLLVGQHELDPAVQVPVAAHAPRAGAARGHGRVGVAVVEGVRIDAQLVVTRRDLEGAEGALLEREALAGEDAAVGGVLAGEHVRRRHLPGLVAERLLVRAGAGHARLGAHVLAEQPEGPPAVVELRRVAEAVVVRLGARDVLEEDRLPGGPVRRRRRARILIAVVEGDTHAEAGEPAPGAVLEGLDEDAAVEVLAVAVVHHGAAPVRDAVHVSELVLEEPLPEVSVQHHAEVAVRDQVDRERALDEAERRRRLEPLEAEGGLELPGLQVREREVAEVDVGVLQGEGARGEVRHDPEVDRARERALQHRPHPAEEPGVDVVPVLFREGAVVELRVAPQLDLVRAVRGAEGEAVGPGAHDRLRPLRRGRLLLHLELAAQQRDLALELLDHLAQVGVGGARASRRGDVVRARGRGGEERGGQGSQQEQSSGRHRNLAAAVGRRPIATGVPGGRGRAGRGRGPRSRPDRANMLDQSSGFHGFSSICYGVARPFTEHGPMQRLLPTLLDAWREAGRHLEIGEAVARVAPLLARRLPLDLLLLRWFDVGRSCVETLAASASRGAELPGETRTEVEPPGLEALLAWCRQGRVLHRRAQALAQQLPGALPPGVGGDVLVGPLADGQGPAGLLVLVAGRPRAFTAEHAATAQALLEPFGVALANDRRLREAQSLREAAEADRRSLLARLGRSEIRETIVGAEAGFRAVLERANLAAPSDVPVLILGETGSGKEVVARAIQ